MHRNHNKGILYILFAWLCFTAMTIVTRYASAKTPLATILLFQNLIGLITVLPWLQKHGWDLLRTQRFGLLFTRSIVSLAAIALSYLAVQRTSLVDTMLLGTTSPLWIPFVVLLWRKIPMNHLLWPGLIGGFIGIVLILQPTSDILHYGSLFALGAGILQSINMVSLRILSYTERNHTVMFYYFLICAFFCLPLSLFNWIEPALLNWSEIAAIGLFFALGQWAFVRAFHHAKASQLGPFCYATVLYSVLIEWVLFDQIPGPLAWLGIALVCAGGLWAIRFTTPAESK